MDDLRAQLGAQDSQLLHAIAQDIQVLLDLFDGLSDLTGSAALLQRPTELLQRRGQRRSARDADEERFELAQALAAAGELLEDGVGDGVVLALQLEVHASRRGPVWLVGLLTAASTPQARRFGFKPLVVPGVLSLPLWVLRVDAMKAQRELGFVLRLLASV